MWHNVFTSFMALKAAIKWCSKCYNVQKINVMAEMILRRDIKVINLLSLQISSRKI